MKILVTGAKGFVGKNLCAQLNTIKDGKDRRFPDLTIEAVYEYDLDSTPADLDAWCAQADFVFNLAGVNRPQNQEEFMQGNFGFASTLLDTLKKYGNRCPIMLSSSQQASLTGRFGNSEYGRSKKAGEDLFLEYERETGAKVLIYRFPNLFGKWCRPNYNSAVATFCNAFANDLPYTVNDPSVELELLYIDDLVEATLRCIDREPGPDENGVRSRVYNIGCSHPVKLTDFIAELEQAFGREARKEYLPMQPGDVHRTYADITRLETELGWKPQVSLNEGVGRFAEWYKDYCL